MTITGSGGAGKTRLALEVGGKQRRTPDMTWFVNLESAPGTPDVAVETARILDVRAPSGGSTTDALIRYLADRDALLVLDNCEHVIEPCAELTTNLLTSCPALRVLATSREALGVDGEVVWTLGSLPRDDAHRLFVERARQRKPEFVPNPADDAAIDELCVRLDRLPLAIELAAARMRIMSPPEILAALNARLDDLGGGRRDSPARHRSVRATVEWSYQLLDPEEQRAFRALAVFVGDFDAAAAVSVADRLSIAMLARLADKSLVTVVQHDAGHTRYRLLETVRQFGHELLVRHGELEVVRRRRLEHFVRLVDEPLEAWPSNRAPAIIRDLGSDYGNVRAALEWAVESHPCSAIGLFVAFRDLFFLFGQHDGWRLGRLALERCPTRDRARVEALITFGVQAFLLVDRDGTRAAFTEAEALSAELGERDLAGWAWFFRGLASVLGDDVEGARSWLEAARSTFHELGISSGEAKATAALGLTYVIAGETATARELLERALAICTAADDLFDQGQAHVYLGVLAESDGGNAREVTRHNQQAVACFGPYRDHSLLPTALVGQAGVLAVNDAATALQVVAAASAMRARVGGEFAPFFRARAERVRRSCEAALGAEAERVWKHGWLLDVDEAIALAFGARAPREARPAGLAGGRPRSRSSSPRPLEQGDRETDASVRPHRREP
ncbi:MAG TPA: hypothetical protein VF711_01210, partial [Acidimicrobiales bacterium]